MYLNEKDKTAIADMVGKFFQNSNGNHELEFRIGKFRDGFHSHNDPEIFYKIKNVYKNYYKYTKTSYDEENFINEITERNGKTKTEKVKKIYNTPTSFVIKTPLRIYNIYNYDIKLSVENEKTVSEETYNELASGKSISKKNKKRWSFEIDENLKLDMTIAKIDSNIEFQIELEVVKTTAYNLDNIIAKICSHLNTILQYKQKNYFVISNDEKYRVLNEYSQLVKNKFFIGAQPETLHFEHLQNLKRQFLLTYKADGERGLLFINQEHNVYILDSNLNNVIKTDIRYEQLKSSVLDVEIIKTEKKVVFLVFDVLFYDSRDLRNDQKYLLQNRLDLIKNIFYSSELYEIKSKPYIDNFEIGVDLMLNEIDREYTKDGLIFVPANEPYPSVKKWRNLLKWKPLEKNSIDFWIKELERNSIGTVYELYVNNPENKENPLELFSPGKVEALVDLVEVENIKDWAEESVENIAWKTTIYNNEKDPDTNEPYMSSTVVEFYWSNTENRFVPMKTRWDKLQNKQKWGNNVNVAKDIWKSIKNPVKLSNIKNLNNTVKNNELYVNMRKHHNYIKNYLYKYIDKRINNASLIELCSGRGGDLNKWMYNNFKKVLGFDISKNNIDECYRRLEKINKAHNYKFIQMDLTKPDLTNELSSVIVEQYDAIVCNFGIHYMFKNQTSIENFLDICRNHLKPKGLIVLTFLDADKVLKLQERWSMKNNSLLYYINCDVKDSNSLWGNEISMYLNGENILSTISNEYLVNIKMFTEHLGDEYKVLEHVNFSEIKNDIHLDIYEKTMSDLYSYIIIEKSPTTTTNDSINTDVVSQSKHFEIPKYFNEIEYQLKDKNFKLFKIATENDFEFVNNLYDYENKPNMKFIEIEYDLEKLLILKSNIKEIIENHCSDKLVVKIFLPDVESYIYYLYMDNEYNVNVFNDKETVVTNLTQWIDVMIGSVNVNTQEEELIDFTKLKLEDLKNMARELKLPVSGKKADLIERIKVKIEKKK